MSRMRIQETDIATDTIFQMLLDNFPDMIHSVDDEGNLVYTNRTAETLLGYTAEELLGMNIRQIYADEVLEAVEKGFSDLKQRGDYSIESIMKARDGTRIPVEIRSFSIYDDNGAFVRTFSIVRDIRRIKDLQDSLVHAGRLAAVGELAAGVAHDIDNPLTVIVLSDEMIVRLLNKAEEEGEDPPVGKLRELARDVLRASSSIRKLSNHLRNFSRGMTEKREYVDLYTSLGDALFMTNNKVVTACVDVRSDVGKGQHFVHVCPNHVEQVFINLISNACDAMAGREKRELLLTVTSQEFEGEDCWACHVADTGTGIPEEIRKEIFNSFFTTKEPGKGTGLGLSICRGIIAEYGGIIDIESTPGEGSVFSVLLPKADME